ncbi:MAG: glycosyltransferase family 4 protein [Methanobacterium sp.]
MLSKKLKVVFIADMDLSKISGDVIRTIAFANELKNNGLDVTILSNQPTANKLAMKLQNINLIFTNVKYGGGSILNILKRTWALIRKASQLDNDHVFIIETSLLGGYFALTRFPKYILDMHGIYFSEIDYNSIPSYIPKGLYKRYNKFLEKQGVIKADKVITVSNSMFNYITNNFGVSKNKVEIIPNGYFDDMINKISKKNIKQEKGMITFVGNLAKWANVDKIIRAAKKLENEKVEFFIVGDGVYRKKYEKLLNEYEIKNVIFTGRIPIEEAYTMIVQSEIMLSPFPEKLYARVACPIKVLEYMAFGKAMVIDEVDDMSRFLKEKNAAIICDPNRDDEFVDKILLLLNNQELKREIGKNALSLSKEFSWKNQGVKLACILEDF